MISKKKNDEEIIEAAIKVIHEYISVDNTCKKCSLMIRNHLPTIAYLKILVGVGEIYDSEEA